MGKKVKKLKYKQPNGTFSEPIPIGVDAANVDLADGKNVQEVLGNVFTAEGSVGTQLSKLRENVNAAITNIAAVKSNYVTKNSANEVEAASFQGQWNHRWAVLENVGVRHTDYPNLKNQIPSMGFLSFWNGAYDSGNQSNLEYSKRGRILTRPKTVFYSGSGVNSETINFSESVREAKRLDIYYRDSSNNYMSVSVLNPYGKDILIQAVSPSANRNSIKYASTAYRVSENKMVLTDKGVSYSTGGYWNTNELYIYEVDAWNQYYLDSEL